MRNTCAFYLFFVSLYSLDPPPVIVECVCPYLGLLGTLLTTYLFLFVVCLKTKRSALICLKTVVQIFGLTRPNIRKTAPHLVRKNERRYGNVTHRTGVAPNDSKRKLISFHFDVWLMKYVAYIDLFDTIWTDGRTHASINSNRFTRNAIIMEMINQLEANHFYGRNRVENALSQLFIVYVIKTWTNPATLTTTSSAFGRWRWKHRSETCTQTRFYFKTGTIFAEPMIFTILLFPFPSLRRPSSICCHIFLCGPNLWNFFSYFLMNVYRTMYILLSENKMK